PVCGALTVLGAIAGIRFIDRLGRRQALLIGVLCGAAGCAVAIAAHDLPMMTVAGALYAAGTSFILPTSVAVVMDRAEPEVLGSAMATLTMSYQLAVGAVAPVWGWLIRTAGFPVAFTGALLVLVGLGTALAASPR